MPVEHKLPGWLLYIEMPDLKHCRTPSDVKEDDSISYTALRVHALQPDENWYARHVQSKDTCWLQDDGTKGA